MPAHPFQTNFTGGEVTEQLLARVDWQKYQNAAACLKNFVVRPHGGAARRAGTLYAGPVRDPAQRVRLVKFEFSITQAYVLEFGQYYIRFWANRGPIAIAGVPVEVLTAYTLDELRELRFEQSADVLYIAHRAHRPAKLQRLSATSFRLDGIFFSPPPTFEQDVVPAANLSMTSAAIGDSITFTATAAVFLAGDVGRQILSGAGRAAITAVTSTTIVVGNTLSAFDTTTLLSGTWRMDGSPNAGTLTPSAKDPVNAIITLTASLAAFRSADTGAYLLLHGGIVRIISVTSTTVVTGQILKSLSAITAALAGAWTLERDAWSDALGWPGVVALESGRLWFAGSTNFPDSVWGSAVDDYENFSGGPADADAVSFHIAASGVNLIRWLKGFGAGMGIGTLANELTMDAGPDQPITPSAVLVRDQTTYGSDHDLDAIRISNVILFVQRGGQRIREFTFNFEANTYVAPDLAIIAEHLTRLGLVEMAYASSPDSILFTIRPDGVLLAFTYERPESVLGWSHHETEGIYESVAVVPNACGTGDEVWVEVNRGILTGAYFATGYFATGYFATGYFALNGANTGRRGLEVFDGSMDVDAGLVYAGPPAGTFTGLAHLEGRTVKASTIEGGIYDLTVVGGSITLPDGITTTSLEVGLPFTSTLTTLRPELVTQIGTAQARPKHWNQLTIRVYCTQGRLLLSGEALDYPEGWDTRLPYTGDLHPKFHLGWDREGQVTIQTLDPLPCTVLGVTGSIQLDDG